MRFRLLVITLILMALGVGALTNPGGRAEPGAHYTGEPGLFTSNRSVRSLCSDGIGVSVTDEDLSVMASAVNNALDSLRETDSFLSEQGQAVVKLGCPVPTAIDESSGQPKRGSPTGVTTPSEHVASVYIVSDELFRASFGDVPYAITTEEIFCQRRSECSGITDGLYIKRNTPSAALSEGLLDAMSFR